ncbi:MAG: hypothetical protein Q7K42_05970, partial [Candidatus Diapherotrites archaeon]|nr:hypothetical protein [Candidatus Diapherotrites archaeon]
MQQRRRFGFRQPEKSGSRFRITRKHVFRGTAKTAIAVGAGIGIGLLTAPREPVIDFQKIFSQELGNARIQREADLRRGLSEQETELRERISKIEAQEKLEMEIVERRLTGAT